MRKRVTLALAGMAILVVAAIPAYRIVFRMNLGPVGTIPTQEILIVKSHQPDTLVFMDPDGSHITERTFYRGSVPWGLVEPRWGNGGILARVTDPNLSLGSSPAIFGYPILITNEHGIQKCPRFWGEGNLWGVEGTIIGVTDNEQDQVFLLDMASCTKTHVINESSTQLQYAEGSSQGKLAVEDKDGIKVINEDGRVIFSRDCGSHPAWSPDGTSLAFYCDEDVHLVRQDGTNERILAGLGSVVDWSADGQWLIYTVFGNEFSIEKIEVSSGNKVVLYEGGHSPSWRP